jgi:hypothetical protein
MRIFEQNGERHRFRLGRDRFRFGKLDQDGVAALQFVTGFDRYAVDPNRALVAELLQLRARDRQLFLPLEEAIEARPFGFVEDEGENPPFALPYQIFDLT